MPLKHQLKRPLRLLTGGLLCLAAAALLAGCGTTVPPSPSSSTWPDGAPSDHSVDARLSLELANDVTLYAISLVGTPYRYGGNTPESGFDCSGLIGHVYQSRAAVNAPRTVALLRDWGQPVASEAARTGDLVLFFQKNAATHAGIYVGQGRFVHAPSSGGTVRLDSLSSRYWSTQVKAFRRP